MITLTHAGVNYVNWDEAALIASKIPLLVIETAKSEQQLRDIDKDRKSAYMSESDPLYMEWQFDQTPESENAWRKKVTEIKSRYPFPSES